MVHGMRRIVDPRAVGAVSQRGVMRMPRMVGELSEAVGVVLRLEINEVVFWLGLRLAVLIDD